MHLCDQLNSEDMKKLAFLMNLPLHNDRVTSLELAECFERKGDILSQRMIDNLIPCLKAIGRIDLSQLEWFRNAMNFTTHLISDEQC